MTDQKKPRLLLVGSTKSDVHIRNYYNLIKGYFDDILIVTGNDIDFCPSKKLYFGLKNPLMIMKSIKALRKIIRDYSPDVIHVHQANSYGYITSMANKGKVPQVLTIWGSDVLLLPQTSSFHKYLVKKSLRASDKITADAGFIEDVVKKLIGSADFTTANFGINLPDITVDIDKKEKLIYSNRLHDSLYNINQIIDGFAEFNGNHPDWKLIIAGRGPLTEALKEQAKKLPDDSYEFIGFVDYETNMAYYQKSTLYVSIPSSDGTSVSLLEAMACGAIPILSDLPANNEWVKSGNNGVIAGNSLNEAFEEALKLDQAAVIDLNKGIIEKKATKEANRKIFEGIYADVLGS